MLFGPCLLFYHVSFRSNLNVMSYINVTVNVFIKGLITGKIVLSPYSICVLININNCTLHIGKSKSYIEKKKSKKIEWKIFSNLYEYCKNTGLIVYIMNI